MDDTLNVINSYLDQFDFYNTIRIPDLSELKGVKKIIVCAMGGSAFPVDVVSDHLKETYHRDLVFLNKDYSLPYWVDEETLVIALSFSGSTEETLSCMQEAMDRKLPLLGISMGGEISRLCSENNIPYMQLPKIIMPRFGSGYIISAIMRTLVELKLIPQQTEEIGNIKIMVEPLQINAREKAQEMAKRIANRLVCIYTNTTQATAGNIAKICINETAKVTGYNNLFSESNHNELASFSESPYPHAMILLTYPQMHKRIEQRFDLIKDLIPDKDFIYEKVNSNFEKILYRDVQYIMFFTYLAYYLALESGHDPVGTPTQDKIKQMLKQIKM